MNASGFGIFFKFMIKKNAPVSNFQKMLYLKRIETETDKNLT